MKRNEIEQKDHSMASAFVAGPSFTNLNELCQNLCDLLERVGDRDTRGVARPVSGIIFSQQPDKQTKNQRPPALA